MFRASLLGWLLAFCAVPCVASEVPYRSFDIAIDGDLREWRAPWLDGTIVEPDGNSEHRNTVRIRLSWDLDGLLFGIEVTDTDLVLAPPALDVDRFHQYDSLQIYLDALGDATPRMNDDDVNLLLLPDGRFGVLRGDELIGALSGATVPQRAGAPLRIEYAAQRTHDGWSMEASIPFAGLGLEPSAGIRLGVDVAANDWLVDHPPGDSEALTPDRVRQLADRAFIAPAPDPAVGSQLLPRSWTGANDFGYPNRWRSLQLTGGPSTTERLVRVLGGRAGGERLDDALRLDGIQRAAIDHVTLAHAADEALQLSWASDVTVQDSMLGETVGDHADRGGALLNYSHPEHPQDRIALIRNLWFRVGGRTPEITCEASNYDGQPGLTASCQQTPLHLEMANNLYVDPGFLVWYNRDVDQNPALGAYRVRINAVGNRFVVRPSYPFGMFLFDLLDVASNELYVTDNRLSRYPDFADYQLFYCCNDFAASAPNTAAGNAVRRTTRHPFPTLDYRPGAALAGVLPAQVGALPHDPLERRWRDAALAGLPPPTDYGTPQANDTFDLDFPANQPPAAPADSDQDGMPDDFETANGLNPANPADRNGTQLSIPCTGDSGYTNLECWLHQRAQGSGQLFANGYE